MRKATSSEARFRQLLVATTEGIIVHRNGEILEVSDNAARMLRIAPPSLIGKRLEDFIERSQGYQLTDPEAARHARLREGIARGADGREFPIEFDSRSIEIDGRSAEVLTFRDATPHKRMLDAIADQRAWERAILDSALDCIVSIDPAGRIVEWNRAAERTFGWRRDEVVGRARDSSPAGLSRCVRPELSTTLRSEPNPRPRARGHGTTPDGAESPSSSGSWRPTAPAVASCRLSPRRPIARQSAASRRATSHPRVDREVGVLATMATDPYAHERRVGTTALLLERVDPMQRRHLGDRAQCEGVARDHQRHPDFQDRGGASTSNTPSTSTAYSPKPPSYSVKAHSDIELECGSTTTSSAVVGDPVRCARS
jgi:PAS domain S-box-containing protein